MKPARFIVLAIALVAGALAAYLASSSTDSGAPPPPQVAQLPTIEVLVAKTDIGLGQTVGPNELQWQTWTQSSASGNFIRRPDRPEAITQITGSIARQPFIAGEPIREQKLVRADGSGFMAAILPSGKRAISTEISAETGAGGFILPNDRVDVILTKREKPPANSEAQTDTISSQAILTNIRVLAIDQAPKEKEGQNAVLGKTATLELTPGEVELLSASRQSGTLSLALRSIADNEKKNVVAENNTSNLVTVYRGATTTEVLNCKPACGRK
ncbi:MULTISPECIES: Flp pilus assembly protein CpaB [unclassified Bradyrhizobium]|uniref:Flp pilus assembly protein CpaB n=1 Tax=unclassified Bradyrhizobium TaxID=2631580 RepID=UPI00041CC765|nr:MULTISPECIES: Flp pilus assembly protein CpaB [unclassified Bradyrhizobium]MCP3461346.1 Flp pilus assembly protein CpaB [Bradyrhizobium sp. CCGUVB23]